MLNLYRTFQLLFMLSVAGCATIVGDKTQLIPISSTPSNANVVITDEKGVEIFKGKTPTNVTLEKSDGSYWGGKDYNIVISKDGFKSRTISVKSSPNGWYIAGNIIFGGIIGWFIVDPFNGAMYTLSPKAIKATMGESYTINHGENTLRIVLMEDVPAELRKHMKPIKLN